MGVYNIGVGKATLIRVKSGYQVTIPSRFRKEAGLTVGDLLQASIHQGRLTLRPTRAVEREIELALEDVKQGRMKGPFKTAKEAIQALRRASR